jgi:drug/metabolite transporter (DMT)-like permease
LIKRGRRTHDDGDDQSVCRLEPELIALAVGYQWFYNGANFLAFKVAGNALHPLMVATLRFSFAALILIPFALLRWQHSSASSKELGSAAMIGIIMLVAQPGGRDLGNPLPVSRCGRGVRLVSTIVIGALCLGLFRQPLARRQLAGVAIGFCGLASMCWTSATGGDFRPIGAALALASCAAWALGSLLAPRLSLPRDPVIGLTVQLMTSALLLGAIVTVYGIAARAPLAHLPLSAWAALAFLVVASTLIGYAVFLALNAQVSPTLANTFNYAVPVIALGLSALLLHERLTVAKLVSGGLASAGAALMIDRGLPAPNTAVVASARNRSDHDRRN